MHRRFTPGAWKTQVATRPADRGAATVLLVDDDAQLLSLCMSLLSKGVGLDKRRVEIDAHAATSGEEALEIARRLASKETRIACALVDLYMAGGRDGIDTILELWKLDPQVQCTLVTGGGDEVAKEIRDRLPDALLDRWDYLAKPWTEFQIVQRVRRSLAMWFGHQQEAINAELQNALRELEAAHGMLLQQEKMACIGQLAAGVAHELNNPIGFVDSNLGTLRRYCGKLSKLIDAYEERVPAGDAALEALKRDLKIAFVLDDMPALVEESLEGTERVRKIVSDLKFFSHPDAKEAEYCDLNEGLRCTLNIAHNEIKYKAKVVTDLGPLPPVRCLPGQINQVLLNLLVNAAQAIDEFGEIRASTRHEKDEVVIRVSDTGCGIPKEVQARIFDPFFTTKEVGQGTGMGLSLSYDIVRKHGGSIAVESEQGKGTTLEVRLPVDGAGGLDDGA